MIFILTACSLKKALAGNLDPTELRERAFREPSSQSKDKAKSVVRHNIKEAAGTFFPLKQTTACSENSQPLEMGFFLKTDIAPG